MDGLGDLGRFILAAAAIYGGIRMDLAFLVKRVGKVEDRVTKLEKANGNQKTQVS